MFGNKIVKTDANGRREFFTYGAFGRTTGHSVEHSTFDGDGPVPIAFSSTTEYDRFGGVTAQNSTQGQNITRKYDDAGRLIEINDVSNGVKTTYGYHLNGQRATEKIEASGAVVRDVAYTYDDDDRLVRWEDFVSGENLNYMFDDAGNVIEVYDDDNARHRHVFGYDDASRLASFNQGRAQHLHLRRRGQPHRVGRKRHDPQVHLRRRRPPRASETQRRGGGELDYDNVGNVTRAVADGEASTNTFLANYLVSNRRAARRRPTTYDKTGRTLSQKSPRRQHFSYTFEYNADGTLASITGLGAGAAGSSQSTYDVNQHLIRLDLGQGDGQDSPEFRTFAYNSDGQILTRFHDDGRARRRTRRRATSTRTATRSPRSTTEGTASSTGRYDPAKIIADGVPADACRPRRAGRRDAAVDRRAGVRQSELVVRDRRRQRPDRFGAAARRHAPEDPEHGADRPHHRRDARPLQRGRHRRLEAAEPEEPAAAADLAASCGSTTARRSARSS